MTTAEQQLAFAKAFGVMPSRQSAKDALHSSSSRTTQPFIDGAEYAQGPVNAPKMDSVLADFDTELQGLATGDPKAILQRRCRRTPRPRSAGDARHGSGDRRGPGRPRSAAPDLQGSDSRGYAAAASPASRRHPGQRAPRRLAVRRAGGRHPRPVPAAADPDGAVGEPHRLERAGQPVHVARCRSSAPTTTRGCSPRTAWPASDFMTSIRNNFYYVLIVVPAQTVLALFLALVRQPADAARASTFFRTAFFFPSVTSSVAISVRVPVHVRQRRRGQRAPGGVRHRRPDVVLRLPRRAAHRADGPSAVDTRAAGGARPSGGPFGPDLVGLALRPERRDDGDHHRWSSGPPPARSC